METDGETRRGTLLRRENACELRKLVAKSNNNVQRFAERVHDKAAPALTADIKEPSSHVFLFLPPSHLRHSLVHVSERIFITSAWKTRKVEFFKSNVDRAKETKETNCAITTPSRSCGSYERKVRVFPFPFLPPLISLFLPQSRARKFSTYAMLARIF